MSVSNNSRKQCPSPPSDHVVEISHGDIPIARQIHSPLTVILLKPITFRCTIQISQKMIQIHLYNLYTIFCKCAHNEHAALTYSAEVVSIHDSLTTILLFKPQTDSDQRGIEEGWAPLKTKTKTWRKKNPGLEADPATNTLEYYSTWNSSSLRYLSWSWNASPKQRQNHHQIIQSVPFTLWGWYQGELTPTRTQSSLAWSHGSTI